MTDRPTDEQLPPWRETPLDHWSTDIDPVMMSGDEWVDNEADPGAERIMEEAGGTDMSAQFIHPTLDTNYGLEFDSFSSAETMDRELTE